MSAEIPAEALQLRSLVRADQTLELFLDMVPMSEPGPDEVVSRVEAAPLNPSDMGLLFGGADMAAAVASGSADRPVVTTPIPDAAMRGLAGRVGTPLPVGNEGAGTVVAAGGSAAAQALLGKVVAAAAGRRPARNTSSSRTPPPSVVWSDPGQALSPVKTRSYRMRARAFQSVAGSISHKPARARITSSGSSPARTTPRTRSDTPSLR